MKACVIIPARFSSSRFPGKPLVKLLGKPMIIRVAEISAKAVGYENVYIATENKKIYDIAQSSGFKAIMTSVDALTGTDRVAEASKLVDYDIYINVQGDEPLLDHNDIKKCIDLKYKYPNYIINGFTKMTEIDDPSSINIPKVITNEKNFMVYMSRQVIPGYKSKLNKPNYYKKQVCIYGFNNQELEKYINYGRKSSLENSEDIEILRFLEFDKKILMYECKDNSHAVDIPEDVIIVENLLKIKSENN
tara:strand:+ start:117 stop:860 length:744 start_codon:yes stop_codon:yes gene_type:complete